MKSDAQGFLDAADRATASVGELLRRQADGQPIDARALARGLMIMSQLQKWLESVDAEGSVGLN